jgi:uncharacterized membrane protein YeaQ/YmgE (transglycosylase-associated protein family)
MSWLWSVISSIIFGAVIGALARLILPGRQNISVPMTIIAGMVAAFVGSLIARAFGWNDTKGVDWLELIIQLVLAVVAVSFVARRWSRPSTSSSSTTPPTTGR